MPATPAKKAYAKRVPDPKTVHLLTDDQVRKVIAAAFPKGPKHLPEGQKADDPDWEPPETYKIETVSSPDQGWLPSQSQTFITPAGWQQLMEETALPASTPAAESKPISINWDRFRYLKNQWGDDPIDLDDWKTCQDCSST